ncbi:putative F-box-like domain superfamily protein [Helianthus anomalus]
MENIGFQMIVDEIFTRLPVEAIGRLKCLSKKFHRELSSHAFEMMHSLRSGDSLKRTYSPLKTRQLTLTT